MENSEDHRPIDFGKPCACKRVHDPIKLIVLTGGPGAGKTAVLELVKKQMCKHIVVLPESASIVFGGGFWRLGTKTARIAAQRAIYCVQREMENLVMHEKKWAIGLCDRGTLDGLAYWPEKETLFWDSVGTTKEKEFEKYSAVIHLKTPSLEFGYNNQNPIRIESAIEAAEIDSRIGKIWSSHPKYQEIESSENFIEKAQKAVNLLLLHIPECCRTQTDDAKRFATSK